MKDNEELALLSCKEGVAYVSIMTITNSVKLDDFKPISDNAGVYSDWGTGRIGLISIIDDGKSLQIKNHGSITMFQKDTDIEIDFLDEIFINKEMLIDVANALMIEHLDARNTN